MDQFNSAKVKTQTKYWCFWRWPSIFIAASVFLILGLWTVYWLVVAEILRSTIDDWITEHNQHGIAIRYAKLKISGYPFWFKFRMENIDVLIESAVKREWRSHVVKAKIRPWQPSKIFLDFSGQHKLTGPPRIAFAARKLQAVIIIEDRGSWSAVFEGEGMNADFFQFGGLSARNAVVKLDWFDDSSTHRESPFRINFGLNLLKVPVAWAFPLGREVTNFNLVAHIEGPIRPLSGVNGIVQWRDNGGILDLTNISVNYGPLKLDGDGTFALDGNLQPIGALTLRLEGFMEAADTLLKRSIIDIGQAMALKLILAALSSQSTRKANRIHVPITLQNRQLALESFNLIKLPKIDWSRILKRMK